MRSYVLHPYQMVKDLRTEHEVGNTSAVFDGEIDDFLEAGIRWKRTQERADAGKARYAVTVRLTSRTRPATLRSFSRSFDSTWTVLPVFGNSE
jgi:hypothetical protein